MMIIRHLVRKVFGDNTEYGFGVPSGNALLYFYRRFGFTSYDSDDYKQVCQYYLPTGIDGLYVSFSFGGSTCYIRPSMSNELRQKYWLDTTRDRREYYTRREAWALENGMEYLVDIVSAHGSPEKEALLIKQSNAWLGKRDDYAAMTNDEDTWFSEEGSKLYFAHVEKNNEVVSAAYEEVEPRSAYTGEATTEFGLQCETAVEKVLTSLLEPIAVRDVMINIIGSDSDGVAFDDGVGEDGDEDDCDEDGDIYGWSRMAGYGIPSDVTSDFDKFLKIVDVVRGLGDGDFSNGVDLAIKKIELAKYVEENG